MGFTVVGRWKNTGFKKGRWIDIVWYQKPIGEYPDDPGELLTFDRLDPGSVADIMKKATEAVNAGAAQE